MIFRGIVAAMVVVAVTSAAVITAPLKMTVTSTGHILLEPMDSTADPADIAYMMTTIQPSATPTPAPTPAKVEPTQSPMISCYCNLPECMAAAGGDGTCATRLGCFSEVQPIIPVIEEEIATPAVTESNNTMNGSAVSPIIPELIHGVEAPVVPTTEHAATIKGSFGCLDLLSVAKQSCDEILRSMEAEISEFPVIQAAPSSADNTGVHAFHCCQTQNCNGNLSSPTEASVKSAQAVLVSSLKKTTVVNANLVKSTLAEPPGSASTNVNASVDKIESFNTQNINESTARPNLWHDYFSMGEPKAPLALQSADAPKDVLSVDVPKDVLSVDATTPAIPAGMPTESLPVAVPASQDMTHDEPVGNVEHVVTKRHDGQRAVPVMKQTADDQENIGDFDDDIAAEVAAAAATAKTPAKTKQHQDTVSSWSPRHGGVPDFVPPPVLPKDNNSYSLSRGENYSNNYHSGSNDSGINDWAIGIICAIVVVFVVGITMLVLSVLRAIRDADVFNNYKGVCSNPGQPCACNGGVTRRGPRTQPSSSGPGAAVRRNGSTAPLLPSTDAGHDKHRGHANAGATYCDSTGDTTYVYTAIPVPREEVPLFEFRR